MCFSLKEMMALALPFKDWNTPINHQVTEQKTIIVSFELGNMLCNFLECPNKIRVSDDYVIRT